MAQKAKKKSKLRHAEYYDMQKTFDSLYADSKRGEVFGHLMDIISAPSNIKLAFRNIKGKAILNYEDVKDKLFIRVSSAEANKEVLENAPHQLKEDLAITYHVAVGKDQDGLLTGLKAWNRPSHTCSRK